jgi:hypothetical protein
MKKVTIYEIQPDPLKYLNQILVVRAGFSRLYNPEFRTEVLTTKSSGLLPSSINYLPNTAPRERAIFWGCIASIAAVGS